MNTSEKHSSFTLNKCKVYTGSMKITVQIFLIYIRKYKGVKQENTRLLF